jgi:hypothetical protein
MSMNVPKNDVCIERHLRRKGKNSLLQNDGADNFYTLETWTIRHKLPDAVGLVTRTAKTSDASTLQFSANPAICLRRDCSF